MRLEDNEQQTTEGKAGDGRKEAWTAGLASQSSLPSTSLMCRGANIFAHKFKI